MGGVAGQFMLILFELLKKPRNLCLMKKEISCLDPMERFSIILKF